ncbi:alpha/beta fold hydrolase [Corynebacterium minutissimum]|uniref:Hydrolase n=1 Tax=Corynebacterium minutissimum TaxID=38301 RepID=A0A376CXP7_9CORY|nr:alpha/beta hydrolase [Corynebacterium minutissimum]QRP60758.1 alpha/beta fold hydrolase [Corynebacterium minutissimum]STC77084.1 hydrolase [Corynebacterium minutissimum]
MRLSHVFDSARAVTATLAAALLGCVGLVISTPATAAPNTAVGPSSTPAPAGTPTIDWVPCPADVDAPGAECGHITVPTFYDAPERGSIQVGFVRRPATAQSRGTIFINPGGPGGDALAAISSFLWPEELTTHYDMVGVQSRGLRFSTPLDCDSSVVEDAEGTGQFTHFGQLIRDACEQSFPGYADSMTTANVARDWEQVRAALGTETIIASGVSYGTLVASTYATFFPEHTDRVVLDSGYTPSASLNRQAASQQRGTTRALADFFGYIAANDATYHLGTTPLQVYEHWADKVRAESGVRPTAHPPAASTEDLPAPLAFTGQRGAEVITATNPLRVQLENLFDQLRNLGASQSNSPTLQIAATILPYPSSWETAAHHIAGIETIDLGNAQTTDSLPTDASGRAQGFTTNLVLCNETYSAHEFGYGAAFLWDAFVTKDPFTVQNNQFRSGQFCGGREPITTPVLLDGSRLTTPPLQLQATGDPLTPYSDFRGMSDAMRSQIVTVHGPGHGQFATGNGAVDDIVMEYLRTGHVSTTDAPGYFEQ